LPSAGLAAAASLRLNSRDTRSKHTQARPQFGCEYALYLPKFGITNHDFEK
jgi:hypothetical protein